MLLLLLRARGGRRSAWLESGGQWAAAGLRLRLGPRREEVAAGAAAVRREAGEVALLG